MPSDPEPPRAILFVCMGNICRSPLAEAVFIEKAGRRGVLDRFRVDSAGTGGWHAGERADPRMRATASRAGIEIRHRARQVEAADYTRFDLLVCMDENNREELVSRGAPEARLRLLLEYDESLGLTDVPDPYYGEQDGFDLVLKLVDSACDRLLEALLSGAEAGSRV